MSDSISNREAATLAAQYKCSVSTIRRMQRKGYDPRDPKRTAEYVLDQRQTHRNMVNAVAAALQIKEEIGEPGFNEGFAEAIKD